MERFRTKTSFSSRCKPAALALMLLAMGIVELEADSLWKQDMSPSSMFADKKAHRVGDIVTVVIQENNGTSRNNNTTTARSSSVDASVSSFLYPATATGLLSKKGQLPAMSFSGKNAFNGGGSIANSEIIAAQIAVKVIDVLPNGNLVVEGRRQTEFSGEKLDAVLRGTVRSDDVTTTNSVFSFNIADASIQYTSHGALTDSQKKGWFTTVWDKVSPF